MNTLLNIKAFLLVARRGSFSGVARELGVAPSVVTKRITRLEEEMNAQLFVRSTRGLMLTDAGERVLPRYTRLVAELEELISNTADKEQGIEGHLRIKSPTTVTSLYLGGLFSEFHALNPGLILEIVLMDRSVNPLEEGFDLVFAARPASYPNVTDIPLCPYPVTLCASPKYLEKKGTPEHPSELAEHDCLTSILLGATWVFESPRGTLSIEVHSKFKANDGRVLLEAVRRGVGLTVIPNYLANNDVKSGNLIPLLQDFPLPLYWLKAQVPSIKVNKPAVRAIVEFLKSRMQPAPPWDQPDSN